MTALRPHAFKTIPTWGLINGTFPSLEAILFDMDGTLFDTEKYHAEAMFKIGEKYKIQPPHSPDEVHALMHGKADYIVFDLIKFWPGFPVEWSVRDFVQAKNDNLLEILARLDPQEYFPKATATLLKEIKKSGKFCGLVTSSEKIITLELLKLVKLHGFFDLIITRDDCPLHKPDPWPYIEAITKAGTTGEKTLIFEDSNVGLIAAKASGAYVAKVEWF